LNFPILPTFPISPSNANNAPTLTLSATNARINNDSAVKIFNNVNAGGGVSGNGVADTGSSSIIKQIVFTVKAVKDFASEIVTIDGVSIPLVNTPADVSFTNGGSYFVTVIGSAVQVTLKNLSLSTADDNNQVNSLIESITYQNISTTPTDGTRQILVSKITDGGVTSSPSNPYAGSNYKDFGNTLLSNVTVDTLAPNAPSTLSVPENDNGGISVAEASDGTMVIVSLVDTMAAVNDVISVVIDGASTLYTITQNDIDAESASVSIPKSVLDLAGYGSAQVTATIKDATSNVSQSSQPVTINVIAPNALPTGEVTILGTPTQGQMLTATNNLADANGMGTVSYTWYADGAEISGATGNTFTLTQAQVDKKMTVTARYFDGQNTAESVTSSQTAKIANINDAPTGVVTITGTATQGQVLTASNTLADVDGLGTILYKWYANGTEISGATAATYTLTQAEVGKAITAKASYTDGGNTVETVSSSATANVANINDAPTSVDKTVTINEDASQIFAVSDFGFTDAAGESDTLSAVIISTLPALGTLTLNNVNVVQGQRIPVATIPTLKYTPALNGNGLNYASIGFKVQDNGGTANGGVDTSVIANTLTIHVTAVNDAPVVVTTPTTLTTLEDTATSFVINTQLAGKVTDADGTALKAIGIWQNTSTNGIWAYSTDGAVTWTNFPSSLTSTPNGTGVMYLNATDSLRFTPTANANGTALGSLNYRAIDATFGTFATGAIVNTNANYGGTGAVSLANGYLNVDVTAVNEAPILTTTSTRAYTENGAAAAINTVITVADLDNTTLASGTVSISTGFAIGQDVLSFTNVPATMGNIAGSYNATTGVMTLTSASSTATIAQWQVAMRAVSYSNTSDAPSTAARTVSYVINDGAANSTAVTSTINVTAVNDAPVLTTMSTLTYTENDAAAPINTVLTVADDNTTLASGKVSITTGFVTGQDVLSFTNVPATMGNIEGAYNATTGVMTLTSASSTATVAQWQVAMRAVSYSNTSNTPTTAARTVSYVINDGVVNSTAFTSKINVMSVNDAPSATSSTITVLEDSSKTFATSDFGFSDVDGNTLSAVIISTLPAAGTLTLNNVNVVQGQRIPVAAIPTLKYTPALNVNGLNYASVGFNVQDNGGVANGGIDTSVMANTLIIHVTAVNDAPAGVNDSDNAIEASGVANATAGINPSGNVLNNDTDVDNATNTLTIKSILKGMTGTATAVTASTTSTNGTSIAGTYGTLVMGADGSYIYSVNQSNVTVQALNVGSAPLSDVFTYTVKDPLGLTSTATITVMVNGANDAAVIAGTSTATLTETNIAQSTSGTLTITDVDSATTFVAQTNVAGSNGYGKFSVTMAGAWTYTMNTAHDEFIAGQAYTDSLTVTSADGTSKLVTVTINGADDAAYISGTSTASLTETDGIQTANGTVAVMDVDSAVNNTFVAQTNVAKTYGNFTISTAGVWSYVMSSAHNEFVAGTNYTDSITVASVTGASKVITVTMVGTNDAAVIGGVNTASLTESNIVQSTGGTLTISDVDSTAAFIAQTNIAGSNGYGTFTLSTTGVWTYSMNTAHDEFLLGQVYTDSMTVKAVDGTTQLVTVSMTGTNDAPTLSYIDTGSSNIDAITNSAAMSVSSLEASATWQYQVDGGTWQTGTGTTFTMSEGTHDYNVRQKDTLNNVSATTSKTVTLDTVAPNAAGVTLASDTGASNTDGVTNNGTVNVSLSSDTNNWQYSTNGGTTWSNGTGTTFSLGAGTYAANSVQVQAFDKAGNVALTKYAPALTVDKSAPTVSVAMGNTALPFGQSTTVNFNFSEAVYGFANADVSVSGGSLSNITGSGQSYSATFTAGYSYNAGSYVSVNANTYTDQAGNNGGSNSTGAFRVGPNVADVARNMSLYVGYYGHNGSDPYGYINIRLSGNNDLQGATVTLYDGWGHSWSRTVQGAGGTTDFGQITGTGDNVTRYHADITYAGISASIGGGVAYEVTSRGLLNWGIFKCISSDTAYSFCYTSPIVLDLNGDGVQTVDTAHGVRFDMAGDGMKESIGWVDSHDALLVRDINHDGQINDGTELFGSDSVLKNGEKAGDGWSALADVDSNGDGKIDAADAVFAEINVWVDANSDGVAETGELRSLSDAGIQHIDVAHATSNTTQNNNVLFGTGQFTFTDGTTAAMTDAWFDVGQTLSLDFTQVNGQPIDMTDGQAQTLQINVQDLVAYTQINGALQILGDAIDVVNIVNDGVAVVAQSQIINDQILNAYDVNQDGVSDLLILLAINQTSLFTVH
jgi:VCBS repeat-containing protein